jgi:uncharacterized protein (TIGR00725 family)
LSYSNILKIGVFGSAGGSNLDLLKLEARIIGREIAEHGYVMVTGGCPGLPFEAAVGASEKGGLVLGISPAMNLDEHVQLYKFPVDPYLLIFTGMSKKGRNIINTRTCNGAIFISGRSGTLNEFTTFYDEATEKNVVGLLAGSGGVVDRHIIPYIQETEKRSKAAVVIAKDPAKLVKLIHITLAGMDV